MPKIAKKVKSNFILKLFEKDHDDTLQKTYRLEEILVHLRYEGKVSLGKNLKQAREVLAFFSREVQRHMADEERVLFPFLKAHLPRLEPLVHYLSSEHQDFRRQVARFKLLLSRLSKKKASLNRDKVIGKLKETGIYLVHLLRAHLQGESEILCKVADRELRQDEKKELKRRFQRWIKRRLR